MPSAVLSIHYYSCRGKRFHTGLYYYETAGERKQKHSCFVWNKCKPDAAININAYTLNREQLGIIYKWLRKVIPGRNIWPDGRRLLDDLRQGSGFSWNGFQLRLALEIFKELDFISIETKDSYIRIYCNPNPVSRNLSESRLVNFHSEWTARHGISDNML